MRAALETIWLYPDGNGHDLKQSLAQRHGVSAAQVTLGNGSNDLLVLLAESFLSAGSSAVYSQYAFAIYGLVVQATGARHNIAPAYHAGHSMPFGHDLAAMRAAIDADTRLVYIANPNNPTGTWNTPEQLRAFLAQVPPTVIVVLDEAYFEYSRRVDCPDGMSLVGEYPNLVVLRTFSKAHALAGVRVGYAISHPAIADLLNRVRQPFNVGIPGLVGATASLGDPQQPRRAVQLVEDGLAQLGAELPRLGLKIHPTAGNFVLVNVGGSGQLIYERLLRQGVIVRPMAGYGLPSALRITIGTAEQNERLIAALATVMQG
jgi:histidinol-phosphate aminotransferase